MQIDDQFLKTVWLISSLVGSFGGVAAAFIAIYQLKAGREQRIRELRWSQAKLAKEMLDEIEKMPKVTSAFRLLDWDGYEYEIKPGVKESITLEETCSGLRVCNSIFTPKEVFIRDCFDEFFNRLGHLEHCISTGLIRFEDVRFPLDYYIGKLEPNHDVYDQYLVAYHFRRSISFIRRFKLTTQAKRDR
ncbi:MAG: hypothetical protein QM796_06430 [Chthoniobacteraceae bacterium]